MPPSAACLIDRLIRRRCRSRSMIFTHSSSPGVTTCSGRPTWCADISEMCTRPSIPSPTCTNDPKGTRPATAPHNRGEGHELRDTAVDQLADAVRPGELLPRVLLRRLEREADALAVE